MVAYLHIKLITRETRSPCLPLTTTAMRQCCNNESYRSTSQMTSRLSACIKSVFPWTHHDNLRLVFCFVSCFCFSVLFPFHHPFVASNGKEVLTGFGLLNVGRYCCSVNYCTVVTNCDVCIPSVTQVTWKETLSTVLHGDEERERE